MRPARYLGLTAGLLLLACVAMPLGAGGPLCGNGMLDAGETCDPPEPRSDAPNRCRIDCRFCGDGTFDFSFEACDDGNNTDGDLCEGDCHILTYVAVTGDDVTGIGSEANRYRTIQHAFEQAGAFYTIMVGPGVYNECVTAAPPVAADQPVKIVAEAWVDDGDNTATTVTGEGTCDASQPIANRAATFEIKSRDSRVEGFTITGGGTSGILAAGNVVITNNLITDNVSMVGGGVYLDLRTDDFGDVTAEISDNVIRDNRAVGDGGGGFVVSTNSASDRSIQVAVTRNMITGNSVESGEGDAGGGWILTYGYGTEIIDVTGNTFTNNTSPRFGGGLSAYISTQGTRGDGDPITADSNVRHRVNLADNVLSGNTSSNGGGLDLLLWARNLKDDEQAQINAARNMLTGNDAFGGAAAYSGGGGGALVTLNSLQSATPDTRIRLEDNTIRSNTALISGGGVGVWVAAETFPVDPIFAAGSVDLVGNLIAGNDASAELAGGGGVFAYLSAFANATSTLNVDLSTIAGNAADFGAGGIHVEACTDLDDPPTNVPGSVLNVRNSIISGNALVGVGGPVPRDALGILDVDCGDGNTGNIDVNVSYSDVFGHAGGNYDIWFPDPTGTAGNISADPLFDDLWRVDACSPTLDAADPTLDFSQEPLPNGGRANMGHSGGTDQAGSALPDLSGDAFIDGVDILKLSVAFGASTGAPRYDPVSDINDDGIVDGSDLSAVAAGFGTRCP